MIKNIVGRELSQMRDCIDYGSKRASTIVKATEKNVLAFTDNSLSYHLSGTGNKKTGACRPRLYSFYLSCSIKTLHQTSLYVVV